MNRRQTTSRAAVLLFVGLGLALGDPARGATFAVQRVGSGPVSPNGIVEVDVFASDVLAPDAVRGYQIHATTQSLAGSTGSLTIAPESLAGVYRCLGGTNDGQLCTVANSLTDCPSASCSGPAFVDDARADWVFASLPPGSALTASVPGQPIVGATLFNRDLAVSIPTPKYLATLIFQASSDALGDFTIDLLVGDDFSFLQCPLDSSCFLTVTGVTPVTVTVAIAPSNDDCTLATTAVDGTTGFITQNATPDGPDHPGTGCDSGDGGGLGDDIWFNYTTSCNGILTVSTCDDADFDTRLAIYTGFACPVSGANLVDCNDNGAGCTGGTSEIVIPNATLGTFYKIRIGGATGATGSGSLTISCVSNDDCANAEGISLPSSNDGSTGGAAIDPGLPACGSAVDSSGVWYTVAGNGNVITASLCDAASYDTRLSVFSGTCGNLTCVGSPSNTCGNRESFSWCSLAGTQYYILVHGAGGSEGTFTLNMSTTNCNDNDACTDDSCAAGVCSNIPNYDTVNDCCNPADASTTPIDDFNPCTTDVCIAATGQVTHTPVPNGQTVECDDGLGCTVDECFNGACRNTDVEDLNIPCQDDGDCPGESVCAVDVCVCGSALELIPSSGTLPVAGCYAIGETLTVRVELAFVSADNPIVGAQFFLAYDPTALGFVSAEPGQIVDPTSPFALELNEQVDEVVGTIDYLVSLNLGNPGTTSAATIAFITFQVIDECAPFIVFRPTGPNGEPNLLSAEGGVPVVPGDLIDLPSLSSNDSAPVLSACPLDATVGSDPGTPMAAVSWTNPTALDSCDGTTTVVCTPPSGSEFAPGTTQVTCSSTNSCGLPGLCGFNVTVDQPVVTADIELSPTISAGPLTRCITFDVWDCDAPGGPERHSTIEQDVVFVSGVASNIQIPIPGGGWDCMTARDPLHTLASTAPDFTTIDGVNYTATFTGDRALAGHWLVGGNLNGDDFIDILDFGAFMDEFLSPATPNTPCGAPAPDANFNGDSVVDLVDFVFVQVNSFEGSEPACCGGAVATAMAAGPIHSISIRDLQRRGLYHLAVADLNHDGVLDQLDVIEFLNGTRPSPDYVPPKSPGRRETLRSPLGGASGK